MATTAADFTTRTPIQPPSFLRRAANFLYKRPTISLILLLLPTLLWLGVVYFGSLSALLVQSFFYLDGFSGRIVRRFSTQTYAQLLQRANTDIVLRTVGMAAAVTIFCALIAFPLAYYMARYASYRVKGALYLGVMLPLWSSYLVRVYAWKLILAQ